MCFSVRAGRNLAPWRRRWRNIATCPVAFRRCVARGRATSAPGLGSPLPHLRRDCGSPLATSAPGLQPVGAARQHLRPVVMGAVPARRDGPEACHVHSRRRLSRSHRHPAMQPQFHSHVGPLLRLAPAPTPARSRRCCRSVALRLHGAVSYNRGSAVAKQAGVVRARANVVRSLGFPLRSLCARWMRRCRLHSTYL